MAKLQRGTKGPDLPGFKPLGPGPGAPTEPPTGSRSAGPGDKPFALTPPAAPTKAVHSNPPTPAPPVPSAADLARQRAQALAAARVQAVADLRADRAAFGLVLAACFEDPRVVQVGIERAAGEWYVAVHTGADGRLTWWYGATLALAMKRMLDDQGPAPKEGT